MGEIKSALEIALEKTKDIQGDRKSIERKEKREKGMKTASSFLEGTATLDDIREILASESEQGRAIIKDGIMKILLTNITLSDAEPDREYFSRIAAVFSLLGNNDAENIMEQLYSFLGQYRENKKQLRDNLAERYQPVLAQKEEEIAKQTGSPVKLQPEQDPEFMKALQENYKQLRARYDEALKQAKDELAGV
jgi:hypothetical protein